MSTATFRNGGAAGSTGTSVTVSVSPAPPAGDVLLAFATTATPGVTISAPSGWSSLGAFIFQNGVSGQGFFHVCGASEPTTYVFSAASSTYLAVNVLDYYATTGSITVDTSTQRSQTAAATSFAAPAIVTSQANETVVVFWAAAETTGALTLPAGVTSRLSITGAVATITAGDYTGPSTPGSTSAGSASTGAAVGYWFALAVTLSVVVPPAPTLTSPANGGYTDLAANGGPFQWTYNGTGSESGYHFRIKASGGSYQYWNAGTNSLQSTDVANTSTTTTLTLPAAALSDGTTYNWSVASVDAVGAGPYALDFTVTGQGQPAVTISAPTGTVSATQMPTVTWSVSGATQGTYRVATYSQTQYTATGFSPGAGPSVDDSGTVNSASMSYAIASPLPNGTSYRSYVVVTSTPGGQASAWAFTAYTVSLNVPAAPTVTATTDTDPTTGCPRIDLAVQCFDNLLTANQASLVSGTTLGWTPGTGTTISAVTSPVPPSVEGPYALKLAGTGTLSAQTGTGTGAVPVLGSQALTAFASFQSASAARTITVGISWYTTTGTFISTSTGPATTDASTGWTLASVAATSPATAGYAAVVVSVSSAAESHFVVEAELAPQGATTWTRGGLVGTTTVAVLRSDGLYVRGASPAHPFPVPTTAATGNFFTLDVSKLNSSATLAFTSVVSTQSFTLYDYEATPYTSYTYTAFVLAAVGGNQLQSAGGTSGALQLVTTQWWEMDPTNVGSATNAQPEVQVLQRNEQSAAHLAMGQPYLTVIAGVVGYRDASLGFFVSTPAVWQALEALLISQRTLFLSSPMGSSYYMRAGPQSGGMSSGSGSTLYRAELQPGSTATAPVQKVTVTFIAQPRPVP